MKLDDVLDVVRVYSDNKISLVKDVRKALGDIKPGDKLVIVKMNDGCFIKKRQITMSNESDAGGL